MAIPADRRGWGNPGAPGSKQGRAYARDHIIPVVAGGIAINVREEIAPLVEGFLNDIQAFGYDLSGRADDWGYAHRAIRGFEDVYRRTSDTRYLSNHSWGLALDLNAQDHPLGKRGTHVPPEVVAAGRHWGFSWGGDYAGRADEMHFELVLTRDEALELVAERTAVVDDEELLLMALAKNDHDARWGKVLEWFVLFLGRPPSSSAEHDEHVKVLDEKGYGACLSGIVNSPEAIALRERRGW